MMKRIIQCLSKCSPASPARRFWGDGLFLMLVFGAFGSSADELRFIEKDSYFLFDTGVLQGSLKEPVSQKAVSWGLTQVTDKRTGSKRARSQGLLTLYRVFDSEHRYEDSRNRESVSKLLSNGSVEFHWAADLENPFEVTAVYQWADKQSLDIAISVIARKDLRDFEVFLSSYVNGSDRSYVYSKTQDGPFTEALESDATWHIFARDKADEKIVADGRWKKEPHPIEWIARSHLSGALGMRRNSLTGETTLLMARLEDCFAISTPYGDENHRSLYLSLFGGDLANGEMATARARLVLGQSISNEQAIDLYRKYLKE